MKWSIKQIKCSQLNAHNVRANIKPRPSQVRPARVVVHTAQFSGGVQKEAGKDETTTSDATTLKHCR